MNRRRLRNAALVTVFGVALGIGGGVTYAAFSWSTTNGADTLATAPDWTAPTGSTVIAKAGSLTSGTINPGSAYYVYANVTDTGNPASGIASVTANVSAITTGQSAAALTTTGGPFTIDGTSYAYRSASLTANAGLTAGSKAYTLTMNDAAGNAGSANGSVNVVVVVGPSAVDIQTTNSGGTAGKPEAGDVVTYTFSTAMAPASIKTGWTGASTTVDVTFGNNSCGPSNDALLVYAPGTTTAVNLGQVCLGANYANGNNKTFANSTMVMSGNSVVITLVGSVPSIKSSSSGTTMVWTPVAAATDTLGNPCSTTAATESGALDIDF
jgi:hypothetical protein